MRPGDELTATLAAVVHLCATSPDVARELAAIGGAAPLAHIHSDRVPPREARPPWIIVTANDGTDTIRMGAGERFMTSIPVTVKVITRGESSLSAGRLVQALCAAIQGNRNAVVPVPKLGESVTVLTAHRTGAFRYPEAADGIEYRHSGATFTVIVQ